jgi:hypothetical protein
MIFITQHNTADQIQKAIMRIIVRTYLGESPERKKYGLQILPIGPMTLMRAAATVFFSGVWSEVNTPVANQRIYREATRNVEKGCRVSDSYIQCPNGNGKPDCGYEHG